VGNHFIVLKFYHCKLIDITVISYQNLLAKVCEGLLTFYVFSSENAVVYCSSVMFLVNYIIYTIT